MNDIELQQVRSRILAGETPSLEDLGSLVGDPGQVQALADALDHRYEQQSFDSPAGGQGEGFDPFLQAGRKLMRELLN